MTDCEVTPQPPQPEEGQDPSPNHFDDSNKSNHGRRTANGSSSNVRTLVDGSYPAGRGAVSWDGRDNAGHRIAPGVYFTRMEAGGYRTSRGIVLLR